jgi:hypothetical protein
VTATGGRSSEVTRSIAVALLLLLLVVSFASAREWVPFTDSPLSEEVETSISSPDLSATVIEVEVPGMMVMPSFRGMPGSVDLAIPGARPLSSPGMPDVPVLSYLVAVPNHGDVRLEVVSLEERVLHGYDIAPARPFEFEGHEPMDAAADPVVYSKDAFYPAEVASIGEPAVLRDLRLADVRINPVRYNPATREVSVVERIKVKVVTDGGQGVNPKRVARDYRSAAFEPIYAAVVDNYDQLPRAEIRRGSYLVITVDGYAASLADFVEWKRSRGVETELVPLSTIGSSPTNVDIKAYIQNAYDTWPNPPDYVLLVGDSTTSDPYGTMPCWYLPAIPFNHVIDHPYAELDGGDYFPDVILGRMSVDSPTEALVACMKVLSYERDCDGPNNTWYKNALMVAGNYGATPPPTSPRQTVLRVREMLYDCGYAQVDTVFYPPYITPNPIGATIDAGVGIVNYRGWGNDAGWHYPEYYVDDIYALSNGNALPIMTSCVCGSNAWESWGYDPCFGEAWIRAGSPGDLKGGPAMIGPSDRNTHTRWNNAMGSGIYQGILYEGIEHMGQMLVRGKLEVWKWFIDERNPDDWVDYYHNIYSVMGDPELWLRLDSPSTFTVSHDATVDLGQNFLEVEVTDSGGGVVPGAEVVLYKDGEFIESCVITGDTEVTLPMPAETAGTCMVTVAAKDYVPYTGSCAIVTATESAGYYAHVVDDDTSGASNGNGDGTLNPGETIELSVTLKNYGTTTLSSVSCDIEAPPNSGLSVVNGTAAYGSITPGATAGPGAPFVLFLDEGTPLRAKVSLSLSVQSGGSTWDSKCDLDVGTQDLQYYSLTIGGDGVLDPGETASLTVTLENEGEFGASNVTGTLRTPTSGLTSGDDTGYWPSISAGGIAGNSGNTFSVTAAADVTPGHEFLLVIDLAGDDGLSQWVAFPLVVGAAASDDPGGPDEHGYYVYDDTDTGYSEAPSYSWVELDPSYGGSGTDLGMAYDEMTNVPLPFAFRFYGEEFSTIGICSNGNIGFGPQPVWEKQPRNTPIGAPLGPAGMAAPFWDDLNPAASGKVLYQNLGGGRFAVEWSRVQTVYLEPGPLTPYHQTFELILYDQDVYPTASGDGEILFQYHTIANADTANGATVGIENLNETDGVEYSFFRTYPDHAAPLAAGRAVKFTTDPPDSYPSTGVDEAVASGLRILGNRPNPFNPVTSIAFTVPTAGRAELSVYDIAGRRVATLVDAHVEAGPHEVVWDGTNDAGEPVASGVYFSSVKAHGEEHSAKMVLLK